MSGRAYVPEPGQKPTFTPEEVLAFGTKVFGRPPDRKHQGKGGISFRWEGPPTMEQIRKFDRFVRGCNGNNISHSFMIDGNFPGWWKPNFSIRIWKKPIHMDYKK